MNPSNRHVDAAAGPWEVARPGGEPDCPECPGRIRPVPEMDDMPDETTASETTASSSAPVATASTATATPTTTTERPAADGDTGPSRQPGRTGDGGSGGDEPPGETPDPESGSSRPRDTGIRAVVGFIGRGLITLGILVLLFVAYQLWGTAIYEARAQNQLETDFEQRLQEVESNATENQAPDDLGGAEGEDGSFLDEPVPASFTEGEAAFKIEIPDAGVDRIVVQGVSIPDLRKGPGHYEFTPMPGEIGNAAIAGHRTTYGQPFHNLDKLEPGDEVTTTTLSGTFVYDVVKTEVVQPTDVDVLEPPGKNTYVGDEIPEGGAMLTLTTCNPKYSAAERLVVFAALNPSKSPEAQPPSVDVTLGAERTTIDSAGLSGESGSRMPTYVFGLVVAAVGALWYFAFRRWRHWYTWFAGAIPFLAVLFFFYTYLERVLPGNY